MAMQKAYIIGK